MKSTTCRRLQLTHWWLLICLLAPVQPPCGSALETKDRRVDEEIIWDLEQAYVAGFRDAAHGKVIPMWHKHFLGWPASEVRPADKQAVLAYLKRYASTPGNWTFEIERSGIQIHGDIAITHFILHRRIGYGSSIDTRRSARVTHTWIRENAQWRILGGMSAVIK